MVNEQNVDTKEPYERIEEGTTSQILIIGFFLVPFIAAIYSVWWLIHGQLSVFDMVLCVFWSYAGVVFVTLGLHRLAAHEDFEAERFTKLLLLIGSVTVLQGKVRRWVVSHRRHHRNADIPLSADGKKGDVSSPGQFLIGARARNFYWVAYSFIYSHLLWMLLKIPIDVEQYGKNSRGKYRHIDDDPEIRWVDKHYLHIVLVSFIIPFIIGVLEGVFSGGNLLTSG